MEQHAISPYSLVWTFRADGIKVIDGYRALKMVWNPGEILLGWLGDGGCHLPGKGTFETNEMFSTVHRHCMPVAHPERADPMDMDHLRMRPVSQPWAV